MKKKIIPVLCGVLAMINAFALVGCGHKHRFETTYVLASCEREGYTLHTCADCGYVYADQFVAPYEHAYEYCMYFFAADGEEESSAQNAVLRSAPDSLPSLDIESLIGKPLHEVDTNQMQGLFNAYIGAVGDGGQYDLIINRDCAFCNNDGWYRAFEDDRGTPALVPVFSIVDIEKQEAFAHRHKQNDGPVYTGTVENIGPSDTGLCITNTYQSTENGPEVKTATLDKIDADQNLLTSCTQLTMPDSILEIADRAFFDCTSLKRAQLSNALQKIGGEAFGSSELEYIVIPESLVDIGSKAFGDCANMKYVFYCGTEAQWNGIRFDFANDPVKRVPRYYYSEEQPTASGNYWHFVDEQPVVWPS